MEELKTLQQRPQRELAAPKAGYLDRVSLKLSSVEEAQLADALAKQWRLDVGVRSLTGLMSALTSRHGRTREIYLTCAGRTEADLYDAHPWLALNLPDCIRHVIDVLHQVQRAPRSTPWAFLFDELEIVPDEIRRNIFGLQRAGIPNVLFKLTMFATTPVEAELRVEHRPRGRDDFAYIPLWYSYKERSYEFCAGLFKQMVVSRHPHPEDISDTPPMTLAESFLGHSRFDLGRRLQREGQEVYSDESEVIKDLRQLASKDAGLRHYLERRDIRLDQISKVPQEERAATIRKLASIAVMRNEFSKEDPITRRRSRRSRKTPTIYSGATTIFAISEGNPRVLIGLSDPMIERTLHRGRKVAASSQARFVLFWSNRFQALLSNYMMERSDRDPYRSPSKEIVNLTERLGRIFEENVLGPEFNGDPVLSFVVDSKTAAVDREAVSVALNAGALVHIPDKANRPLGADVVGHRFRLSYLFAPRFRLPPIVGKERALSELLKRGAVGDLFEGNSS